MSFAPAVPRRPTAKIFRKRAQAKRIQSTGGSRPHRDRHPEARSRFVFLLRGKQKLPSPSGSANEGYGTTDTPVRSLRRKPPVHPVRPRSDSGPSLPPAPRHALRTACGRPSPAVPTSSGTHMPRPTANGRRSPPCAQSTRGERGGGWKFSADASVGPVFVAPGRYMQGQQPDGRRL